MAQPPRPEDFGAVPVSSAGPRPEDFGGAKVDSPAASAAPVTGTPQDWQQQTGGGLLSEVPRAVVQNMGAGIASGFAGLAGAVLPGPEGQGADWTRKTQQTLSYEPKGAASQGVMKVLGLPGEAVSALGHKVGEQGAKVSPALGAIGETSVEALPLLLGARAAMNPAKLTSEQQRVADARDAGFKMTPEEMGAGRVARGLSSFAGEPRLARKLSNENAEVALAKAKEELGLRPNAPLDMKTLQNIRKDEGQAYEKVRGVGQVTMDAQYLPGVEALAAKHKSAAQAFPGAQKLEQLSIREIDDVISMLKMEDPALAAARAQGIKIPQGALGPQTFPASGAVDMIGALREGADGAFHSGKAPLGKVMRGGAEALELQLERHLKATGQEAILADFQAARTRIAKTYAVEKALIGDDTISMPKLGQQVTRGKPLTGGLRESGEFARNFDRSSQKPNNMPTGASFADLIPAAGGALGAGWPGLGAYFARPAARGILSSDAAQWAMDPRTNLSGPAMEAIGASTAITPRKEKR